MARFAPWEAAPRIAVAVSGGPDSLALALLADRWARDRGGRAHAITVDHGLRPDSAEEARRVAGWLAAHRIAHAILAWAGPHPATGIQAAARAARYRLLIDACRADGILHLLLAHHRQDQAETVTLRRDRASGADGRAGMAAVRETAGPRLLRPLLAIDPARLRALLTERGQPWIDDPSNRDRRFARVRLRLDGLAGPVDGAAAAARRDGERTTAALAARTVEIAPEGHALVDLAGFLEAPAADALRLLAGLLRVVGGGAYPPRSARLDALRATLGDGLPRARTIAGCRVLRWRGRLLICREPGAVGPPVGFDAGGTARWDRRFDLRTVPASASRWRVTALGAGSRAVLGAIADGVPPAVLPTLATIRDGDDLLAVPSLDWRARADLPQFVIAFAPSEPLVGGPFAVV